MAAIVADNTPNDAARAYLRANPKVASVEASYGRVYRDGTVLLNSGAWSNGWGHVDAVVNEPPARNWTSGVYGLEFGSGPKAGQRHDGQ